jgi:hypothetical protein
MRLKKAHLAKPRGEISTSEVAVRQSFQLTTKVQASRPQKHEESFRQRAPFPATQQATTNSLKSFEPEKFVTQCKASQ